MNQEYKIPDVPAEIIMEAIEGACFKSGITIDDAASYIGKSKEYARRALIISEQIGIAKKVDSKFEIIDDAKVVTRANKDQWPIVFRKFLQRYNPFILFVSLIGKGNSLNDAARKIKVIYGIDASVDIIIRSLVGWGDYAGLLRKKDDKVELLINTEKLSVEYIQELLEAMAHDVKARMYIANKLGEEVFGYMKQDEVDLLVQAIREHLTNPKHAIDIAGQAFEDFLRRVATDSSINVTSCTGIQQLADSLIGSKKITSKHHDICKGINAFRIAAGHNKDKVSLEKWNLNPDAAIECILLILTATRSIHSYVFKQAQVF